MNDSIVSIRKLVNYAERVFDLGNRLEQVAEQCDRRRNPLIAMSNVLRNWLLGLWKGIGSMEGLERAVVKEPVFRRYGGWPEGVTGSAKTLGRVLEAISLEAIEALAQAFFFQARQSKMLEDATVAGLRLAAVDASELIRSETIHCEECQRRTKRVKREGELVEV
ncbi:MAG: hypothetical protein HY731_06920, partial [Candidatus Tectomicrobia bacterium]|nr:hypothetical protein [Candidatus Tectomicrobia bacterium]